MMYNDLIQRMNNAEQAAYSEFVKIFGSKVYNTVLGILQNREDAEDLTQEIFVSIFKSIHQFRGDSKLTTWIYRITVSKCYEFLRKKNTKKRFVIFHQQKEDQELSPLDTIPDFEHPGIQLEKKEMSRILFAAIAKLPENQKTAFVLSKIEILSYAEIAEVMGLTVSSVESLLFRAKQNLQKLLRDYYEKKWNQAQVYRRIDI